MVKLENWDQLQDYFYIQVKNILEFINKCKSCILPTMWYAENHAISFTWNLHDIYFEVEFLKTGKYNWCIRQGNYNNLSWEDDCDNLPDDFFNLLYKYCCKEIPNQETISAMEEARNNDLEIVQLDFLDK